MRARCKNVKNPAYKYYGGRGITVCDRWKDFRNFYEDMGDMKKGDTLDRIDNNNGYFKDNCRWITIQEQQKNRRDNNDFVGVRYEEDRGVWRADISRMGKRFFLGRFDSLERAKLARIEAEKKLLYAV
jgi:hypothetical protein